MGVGMPQAMLLDLFGDQVWSAFDKPAYLVGSALREKSWRDVDIRLILDEDEWNALDLGDHKLGWSGASAKWMALCLAFSALGKQMTGLPIDFQIQYKPDANERHKGCREPIGLLPWREAK